jgi:signal transduction histidine kinase
MRRPDADPDLAPRALQAVHDNATRQARLIEELLDFSRVSSGHLTLDREEVEVGTLLRDVVESLLPETVAKGVTLECPPAPPARVLGDRNRLEQVFFNLLGNAVKFTPSGGQIAVSVSNGSGLVEVRVADTGMGIEPDLLPYVFDRFKQGSRAAAREYGGLGLGLSIARQLVHAHDGQITVDSPGRGRGTTFCVALPAAAQA